MRPLANRKLETYHGSTQWIHNPLLEDNIEAPAKANMWNRREPS